MEPTGTEPSGKDPRRPRTGPGLLRPNVHVVAVVSAQNADYVAELRYKVEANLIEVFRKALMVDHHHHWDMETVSAAAHTCAKAWCDTFGRTRIDDCQEGS